MDEDGERVAEVAELTPEMREAIARRAYEISLSPRGASAEQNWRRAEEELMGSPEQ
jgi:hypothetical protein